MAADGALKYPIMAVNEAKTKHLFDNRYGTGQSTLDGIIRATNRLLAGRTLVVSGYGWCGRGIAMRASGMGSNVVVLEVDPLKALEAVMDGYRVMPAVEAAAICDIWVTVTGDLNVIDNDSFAAMKDGAIICNSGHFNAEINIPRLRELAVSVREVRPLVDEFTLADGRRIYLLAEGRLVNLSCAEGHPANVMDMSFANQALAAEYMVINAASLTPGVYDVPEDIDAGIAKLKLETLGVKCDVLTPEQAKYLASWEEGTV
jgi:adenosylhomocysteinase